jgi:hypothetical protein
LKKKTLMSHIGGANFVRKILRNASASLQNGLRCLKMIQMVQWHGSPIVIDNGTGTMEAGFAGGTAPRIVLPTVFGFMKIENGFPVCIGVSGCHTPNFMVVWQCGTAHPASSVVQSTIRAIF